MNKIPKVKWTEWQETQFQMKYMKIGRTLVLSLMGVLSLWGRFGVANMQGSISACIDIDNALGIKEFLSKFGKVDTLVKTLSKNYC